MLQTLFHIPEYLFQSPWIWVWVAILGGVAFWESRRTSLSEALMTWGIPIVGLFLFQWFVLPQVTDLGIDPNDPSQAISLGLAVRGYGLMMLLGIVAGVSLAIYRGHKEGLTADLVLSLAMSLAICGIVGARVFFVIQYWDRFADMPFGTRLVEMINMTKGGLVVFGSFIGASLAAVVWSRIHKVSAPKVADLIAPSFLVGLALGRIGCFLNGCCFGGYCEIPQIAVRFPAGSAPYERQINDASLIGVTTIEANDQRQLELSSSVFGKTKLIAEEKWWRTVTAIQAGSAAELLGVKVGDEIFLRPVDVAPPGISFDKALRAGANGVKLPPPFLLYVNQSPPQPIDWSLVPKSSQPIHPTQIYSMINACLLAVVVLISYRFRSFDGQSFVLMMILYSITRFILEEIRTDEAGQFGTPYSISQLVAMFCLAIGIGLMIWGYARGKKLPEGTIKATS